MFEASAEQLDERLAAARGVKVSDKPDTGWYGPFNWANWFTLARVPAAVWATSLYDDGSKVLGFIILTIAALTDLIDGFVAKKTGRHSKLGAMMDPGADYLFIIWVAYWMIDRDLIGLTPVLALAITMVVIATMSTRHMKRTGAVGTSMNAKLGMTLRSAGLGAYIVADMVTNTIVQDAAIWSGGGMIVLGIIFGLFGLADFLKEGGSN